MQYIIVNCLKYLINQLSKENNNNNNNSNISNQILIIDLLNELFDNGEETYLNDWWLTFYSDQFFYFESSISNMFNYYVNKSINDDERQELFDFIKKILKFFEINLLIIPLHLMIQSESNFLLNGTLFTQKYLHLDSKRCSKVSI